MIGPLFLVPTWEDLDLSGCDTLFWSEGAKMAVATPGDPVEMRNVTSPGSTVVSGSMTPPLLYPDPHPEGILAKRK